MAQGITTDVGDLEFNSLAGQIRHSVVNSCDVFSELCCLGAKPWRWALPLALVTRFGSNTVNIKI